MTAVSHEPRLDCYSRTLQNRVDEWLLTDEAREMAGAALYRHLPALFRFLAGVALDHRVPERERTATLSALKYVVAPYDLIPEGLVGVSGFRDDLVLAALTVERLAGRVSGEVLSDHWERDDAPLDVSKVVLDSAPVMVDPEILEELQAWHEAKS